MKKITCNILIILSVLITACNLQVQTVPPVPTLSSFAIVEIPKPAPDKAVGTIVITGIWIDDDNIKVNINYTGTGDLAYQTIDYSVICNENIDEPQSGKVTVNGFVQASCHGSSYAVFIQGNNVWHAEIVNGVVQPVGSYTGYVYHPVK